MAIKTLTPLAVAALFAATPALADGHTEAHGDGASTEKQTLMPEAEGPRVFMEQFGFSEAVIHGDTVYLSGVIVGAGRDGTMSEEGLESTFQYLGSVLERAGSSWDDVIELTTYHTDIDASMPAFSAVKNRYIKAPFPAWTAIDVDRLFTPDGVIEIKITARVSPE